MLYKSISLIVLTCILGIFLYAQNPGENLKRQGIVDTRLALTITGVKKTKEKGILINVEFKNISYEPVNVFFENCPICFWSISVNRDDFFPLHCIAHKKQCPYQSPIELEPGQSAVKELQWHLVKRCRGKIVFTGQVQTIQVRYLVQRESSAYPALYVESNEFATPAVTLR